MEKQEAHKHQKREDKSKELLELFWFATSRCCCCWFVCLVLHWWWSDGLVNWEIDCSSIIQRACPQPTTAFTGGPPNSSETRSANFPPPAPERQLCRLFVCTGQRARGGLASYHTLLPGSPRLVLSAVHCQPKKVGFLLKTGRGEGERKRAP